MTGKEAVKRLEEIKEKYIHGGDEGFDEQRRDALSMGVEALQKVQNIERILGEKAAAALSDCGIIVAEIGMKEAETKEFFGEIEKGILMLRAILRMIRDEVDV